MLKHFAAAAALTLASASSQAVIIFQDNFSDGVADGWTPVGVNSSLWSAASQELQTASTQTNHAPSPLGPGAALINGLAMTSHFSIEANVRVVGPVPNASGNPLDFGHVGFVWGWSNSNSYNTAYLRTHSNHVTAFSKPIVREYRMGTSNTVNNPWYFMKVEVDTLAQSVSLTLDSFTQTFSGAAFSDIHANTSGAIGMINWGERVAYDNVVVRDLSQRVPLPGTLALLAVGLAGLARYRRT